MTTVTSPVWDAQAMPTAQTQRQLASYKRRYRALARQLAEVDYIASGSVANRFRRCGRATCPCASDPSRLHGPYWQFTAKVDGRTVNKRLSEPEARLYEEWISNDRTVRALLAEMREVAAEAQALILEDANGAAAPQTHQAAPRRAG